MTSKLYWVTHECMMRSEFSEVFSLHWRLKCICSFLRATLHNVGTSSNGATVPTKSVIHPIHRDIGLIPETHRTPISSAGHSCAPPHRNTHIYIYLARASPSCTYNRTHSPYTTIAVVLVATHCSVYLAQGRAKNSTLPTVSSPLHCQ